MTFGSVLSSNEAPHEDSNSAARTAVVIVGFRHPEDIAACVRSLQQSVEKSFAIHVCENGGEQAFADLVAAIEPLCEKDEAVEEILDDRIDRVWSGRLLGALQPVRIYRARRNLGFAGGVNACIRQIRQSMWSSVWLLNPDAEPEPEALSALLARVEKGDCAAAGSRLVLKAMGKIQAYGGRWRVLMARGSNLGFGNPIEASVDIASIERSMDYVLGSSLLVTRLFIDQVGLMNERYFLYCEEVDWCLRGRKLGLGYAHESVVIHQGSSTIGSSASLKKRSKLSVYLVERNGLLLSRTFFPWSYPFVAITTLLLSLRFARASAWSNFRTALRGWRDGVRGLDGPVEDGLV